MRERDRPNRAEHIASREWDLEQIIASLADELEEWVNYAESNDRATKGEIVRQRRVIKAARSAVRESV